MLSRPTPHTPGPDQESVWDYPRPPRCEPTTKRLRIEHGGETIAETTNGFRVLETSHPPVYYFPRSDCRIDWLKVGGGLTVCEFKGQATYLDLVIPSQTPVPRVAWFYAQPATDMHMIAGHIAFYAGPLNRCTVDGETVTPQMGEFYGGWITSDLAGPFKGVPGSNFW